MPFKRCLEILAYGKVKTSGFLWPPKEVSAAGPRSTSRMRWSASRQGLGGQGINLSASRHLIIAMAHRYLHGNLGLHSLARAPNVEA